jgi:hypothetical protein
MTMAEAISCCDSLINFMEQKSFTTEQEILQMYRLKEKFEKERRSKSKQTTLTDLFKTAVAHPILHCLQILLHEILIISSCAPPLICRSTRISQ